MMVPNLEREGEGSVSRVQSVRPSPSVRTPSLPSPTPLPEITMSVAGVIGMAIFAREGERGSREEGGADKGIPK